MEQITDDIIASAKAAHPSKELHLLKTEHGSAIFQVPPAEIWDTYWDLLVAPESRGSAFKHLVFGSIIYPDRERFVKEVAARPGLVNSFADKLVEIAGNKRVTEAKKL